MKQIEFDLGLLDDNFWKNCFANREEVLEKLDSFETHTIGIGTPGIIDRNIRKSFPLVIYQMGTPKDHYYYDLELSGLVVTIDAERNKLYYGIALEVDDEEEPQEETSDESYTITTNFMVDLVSDFNVDLEAGKYLTVVLVREYASNRTATVVKSGSGFYKDEEVEKFIEAHRKTAPIPDVWPPFRERPRKTPLKPLSLPIYTKYEGSPELPEKMGISVEPTRVQFAKKDAVCLVRGSFRLPATYGKFVPPDQRSKDKSQPVEYLRMPIHIIITGEKSSNPFTGQLMIPVYDEVKDRKEDKPVTGYFAFDLLKHVDLAENPQTYFLYLFSGEVMVGPVPFAFVDPKEVEP